MIAREAWSNLREKFTSGNNVTVKRATITREEYEAILGIIQERDTAFAMALIFSKRTGWANDGVHQTAAPYHYHDPEMMFNAGRDFERGNLRG